MVESPGSRFAVFIGHTEQPDGKQAFEVWVNGAEQPRGLAALAKSISMDMRAMDHGWLKMKLDSLSKTAGQPFSMAMPPEGRQVHVPGSVASLARLIRFRCDELAMFDPHREVADLLRPAAVVDVADGCAWTDRARAAWP